MTFPDYEALLTESNPDVPGAHVRLALLRRGAELEREKIVALLERACTCKCENNCAYCDAIVIIKLGHL